MNLRRNHVYGSDVLIIILIFTQRHLVYEYLIILLFLISLLAKRRKV